MADLPAVLAETLRPGTDVRLLDDGIWTVLPDDAEDAEYDSFGRSYDRLVGNGLYLSWIWDARRDDWTAYARRALESTGDGPLLDVACGSLTFTAQVYATASRPVVLLDRSLTMLQMARERLSALGASDPILLHGDAFALPLADHSFTTIASHGSLHVFDDPSNALREANRCRAEDGGLYLTCLVDTGRWLPRKYMEQMRRMGHFGPVRTAEEFVEITRAAVGRAPQLEALGSLAYLTV